MARKRGDFMGGRRWQELRRQRLVYAHWQCECCAATQELQLDHIVARANGGGRQRLGLYDVQILCRRWNQLKGTSSLTAAQLREVHRIQPGAGYQSRSIFTRPRRVPRIG